MDNIDKILHKKRDQSPTKTWIKSFFQALNKAILSKAISFEHPFIESPSMFNFLNCLMKERRIAGYKSQKEKQKVIIFLSYYDSGDKTPFTPPSAAAALGRIQISSVKALQDFHRQNPAALTFIGTKMGVMTLKDCLQRKCGGQILISTT